MIICIDPGHGGSASGAVSPSGILEKNITLEVSDKLKNLIDNTEGLSSLMTRKNDLFVSLTNRCIIANSNKSCVFISIHCNSAENHTAGGIETYCYREGTKGNLLAKDIQDSLIASTGLHNRKVKAANFHVLRGTKMPAVLVELPFLSNENEEKLYKDVNNLNKFANAIFIGIKGYLDHV